MKPIKNYVALVDERNDFISRVGPDLKDRLEGKYAVKSFTEVKKFIKAVKNIPYEFPIVVIADSASYSPNFEDGPFKFLQNEVPVSKGIIYTSDPTRKDYSRFVEHGFVENTDIIKRKNEQSVNELIDATINRLDDIEKNIGIEYFNSLISDNELNSTTELGDEIYKIAKGQINPIDFIKNWEPNHFKFRNPEQEGDYKVEKPIPIHANEYDKYIHDILVSGKFQKYVRKEKLNGVQKFVFKDLVRFRLIDLIKNNKLKSRLKSYFEDSRYQTITDAWKIYRKVYLELNF